MTTRQEPMAGTQSVLRALDMLDVFNDDRPVWTVSELAEATGLNRTTAYRLLTALESREYVTRDSATDTYRLGSEPIALGGRAARANSVRVVSHPELARLAHELGETATLEILSGHDSVIIDEVPGDYVTSGSQHIGSRWPAYATSTGKAIMAYLSSSERLAALPDPPRPLTKATLTQPAELSVCFERVRRLGYAVASEELELGYVAVGAPIFNADGRPVAAISVGGTIIRVPTERVPEVGQLVLAAAQRVSYQLGYRPGILGQSNGGSR